MSADPVVFSSVTFRLERRAPRNEWRVVWERVDGDTRTIEKTDWLPRVKIYAHVALRWKQFRAFVYEGMGRVPA